NEVRQCLQRVDDDLQPAPQPVPLGRQYADRNSDQGGDDDGYGTQINGDHRLFPLAGCGDQEGKCANERGEPQPAEAPPGKCKQRGDAQPWQAAKQALEGNEDIEQDGVLDRLYRIEEIDVDPTDHFGEDAAHG